MQNCLATGHTTVLQRLDLQTGTRAGWRLRTAISFHAERPRELELTLSVLLKTTCCQVLELRESRLDHEETLGEVQKAADEHKRNLDRQVRTCFLGAIVGCHNITLRRYCYYCSSSSLFVPVAWFAFLKGKKPIDVCMKSYTHHF